MQKKNITRTPDRYEMILKNIQMVIWESDINGNTLFITESIEQVLGYIPRQFLQNEIKWFDIIHPSDKKMVQSHFNAFLQNKKDFKIKYRVLNKNNEWIWILDTAYKKKNIDENYIAAGTFVNITNENEIECEDKYSDLHYLFKLLFDNSLDSIFVLNENFKILEGNPSVIELFGAQSKEEFFSINPIDYSPKFQPNGEKSTELSQKTMGIVFDNGIHQFEWTHRKITGETFHTRISMSKIDLNTELDQYLVIMRDITSFKKAEQQRLLINKHEALSLLAGGVAHDYNNILSIIQGNLDLCKMAEKKTPDLLENLLHIEEAVIKAKKLTTQLTQFSKSGAPVKENYSLSEIIRDSSEFIKIGSSVIIKYEIDNNLWNTKFSKIQISQVIQNLVLNAIHAMNKVGRIRIVGKNIDIEENDLLGLKRGKYIRIDIEDKGKGIPKEILNNIFDPYFTTKHDGTGLGLSICQSIIHKHGGLITFNSKIGNGTTFTFYLPKI